MSGISKRVSGSWVSDDYGIMKNATDTITTLPAVLYPNDTTATVGLKGNTVQNGTPTPDNPIMPQGTGEMTGNLCPDIPYKTDYSINANGVETDSPQFSIYCIPAEPETEYALSLKEPIDGTIVRVHAYKNGEWQAQLKVSPIQDLPLKFTTITNCDELRLSITTIAVPMLNTGSTALPYEPWGIEIPISSANTTTPVYLGEVETTRKIKKYEFTGKENISDIGDYYNTNVSVLSIAWGATISTTDGFQISNSGNKIWARKSNFSSYATPADFKSYLAQQYANGTPVTVWYVLATPETAIVNEPLMKIGDYADEVSGITIPVTAGANTLSVDTTVQPSEVTATYKGWHPVADVHEYDSNYTIATMQALTIAQLQTHTISDLQGGEWS